MFGIEVIALIYLQNLQVLRHCLTAGVFLCFEQYSSKVSPGRFANSLGIQLQSLSSLHSGDEEPIQKCQLTTDIIYTSRSQRWN